MYKLLFRPLYNFFGKTIKTDNRILSIFFLSLIGGYPIGFKLLKELIAENKNYSAIVSYCSAFCYCISPSFAVTMIGIGLYQNIEAGLIVYVSNVISCIIISLIYCRIHNLTINSTTFEDTAKVKQNGLSEAINSSFIALAKMCSVIIFFNAAITVLECFCQSAGIHIPIIIKSILEISNILKCNSVSPAALPFISALASVGGICVIFQCKSLIDNTYSLKSFFIARFFSALISFASAELIITFWDISSAASTFGKKFYSFDFSVNKGATVFLLIMCIILMQKSEKIFKKG